MTDLKFEQKRSLSRFEAADQLTALAAMMRAGGDAELELAEGTLSLRIPDDLRGEIEVEVGDGQIELEIEFKWTTTPRRTAPPHAVAAAEKPPRRKSTAAGRSKAAKRSATKTP
ncbi:amphi-Trp domain-containing protein [Streptomyces sp. NRRL F-2747]|uniref:amphi-Trp domain-containing protein n=1 Tax=Streptomyces sp. NRRL F-2747 TaxID=1463843 RepID=UPI0004C71401|nr:amphi-Trp domain-containing protein [Streptomyces sp. NRRL F-2747]